MVEVRIEGIEKRFGETAALRRIDLVVRDGEFMTLVGPSGCGKSTLLNLVAGLEAPTAGGVLFDGVPVNDRSPRERDVALVFQTYALYPHMSVFENVAFPLKMARVGRGEIARRVGETAALLRIGELLRRRPRELSGGQRQRVALGRAIVRRPKIFLFDEPLSNLDAQLRLEMRAELKRLHRELATTFLYVTHDQTEAMTLSQRLAVLRRGEILQVGTPEEVYREPADAFVATFLGSPPMNLVPARLLPGENAVEVGGQRLPWPAPLPRASSRDEVLLGVRPEHLSVSRSPGAGLLSASVSLVEPLGSESLLRVECGGAALVARVPPAEPFESGEVVRLGLEPLRARFFDPGTGRRLA